VGEVRRQYDGDVYPPTQEIEFDLLALRLVHLDPDAGEEPLEANEQRRYEVSSDRVGKSEPDMTLLPLKRFVRDAKRLVHDRNDVLAMQQEARACRGQGDSIGPALEEIDPESCFQLMDGGGDRRLRDVELDGGSTQLTGPRRSHEIAGVFQRETHKLSLFLEAYLFS
jgi:hypothetical protein